MPYGTGHIYVDETIASLLTECISNEQLAKLRNGVLIFHSSPLPYGRNASSNDV
ncbi:MAG: hypothetical protein LBH06_02465 [Rikenellaceae bacterium]|nr:hypothetical protein [Rikenellaceae bacterium]